MPIRHLHAAWLFAPLDPGQRLTWELEQTATTTTLAFQQVTEGQGGLIFGASIAELDTRIEGQRKRAAFSLRSVDPPQADPGLDSSPYLLAVRLFVPEPGHDQVRRWLDEEHSARQLAVPGTHWYLGYDEVGGDRTFLNLWGLAEPAVIETAAWAEARDTPWRARIAGMIDHQDRAVYRPIRRPITADIAK